MMKRVVVAGAALLAMGGALLANPRAAEPDVLAAQINDVASRIGQATAYLSLCPLHAVGASLTEAANWLAEHDALQQAGQPLADAQVDTIIRALDMTVKEVCAKAEAAFGPSGYTGVNWLAVNAGTSLRAHDLLAQRDVMAPLDPARRMFTVIAQLSDAMVRCPDLRIGGDIEAYLYPLDFNQVIRGYWSGTFFAEQQRIEHYIAQVKLSDPQVCSAYMKDFGTNGRVEPGMLRQR